MRIGAMKKQSQNKANFIKVKMNVNLYVIKEYENISRWRLRKNKPNQTQFQRQKNAAKMIDFFVIAVLAGYALDLPPETLITVP